MVVYAAEVLFKTKMDQQPDEAYEKEHKKEINKIGREMAKHLDTMIEEKIIEGKYRIGGNAPALVYRAMKTFGVEEPVEEKPKKKTKKAKKAAEPEPAAAEEKPQPTECQPEGAPAPPIQEEKPKKVTKTQKQTKTVHQQIDEQLVANTDEAVSESEPEPQPQAEPAEKKPRKVVRKPKSNTTEEVAHEASTHQEPESDANNHEQQEEPSQNKTKAKKTVKKSK
jgi:hypothetical protein